MQTLSYQRGSASASCSGRSWAPPSALPLRSFRSDINGLCHVTKSHVLLKSHVVGPKQRLLTLARAAAAPPLAPTLPPGKDSSNDTSSLEDVQDLERLSEAAAALDAVMRTADNQALHSTEATTSGSEPSMMALPALPASLQGLLSTGYAALGLSYAVVGGALAVAAWQAPQLLVPASQQGLLSMPPHGVLAGCVAASMLQASGLMFFLRTLVEVGEGGTWRHVRLSALMGVFGAAALLSQVPAVTAASPFITGPVMVLGAATVVLSALAVRGVLAAVPRPFQWFVEEAEWQQEGALAPVKAALALLGRDFSTLAGTLLVGGVVLGAVGAARLLLCPSSWGLQAVGLDNVLVDAGELALRRLAGCSLLLLAASSHCLLDLAQRVRNMPVGQLVPSLLVGVMEAQQPVPAAVSPPPARFTLLNVALLAATVLQAVCLSQAPGLGVDVNSDGLLWGLLHAGVVVPAAYLLTLWANLDWGSVRGMYNRAAATLTSLVAWVMNVFVWRLDWQRDLRTADPLTFRI